MEYRIHIKSTKEEIRRVFNNHINGLYVVDYFELRTGFYSALVRYSNDIVLYKPSYTFPELRQIFM